MENENGSYATYGQENYKKWKRERERKKGGMERKRRERERKRPFIKINL